MEVPGGAKVSKVARVHMALETDGGGMTETVTFPLADAVGALAALGSVRAAAKVEPAASDAGSPAAVSFRAEGRGKSFVIEALFCTPHASSEAFEKWVGDVLLAAAPKRQWLFARFAEPSRITSLSLLACTEPGVAGSDDRDVDSDAVSAKMREGTVPAELTNMCIVTVKAIGMDERRRRVAAITALEAPSDACITRYFGHFRRPDDANVYISHDDKFASTAFEIRIAFQTVPTDEVVRQTVARMTSTMFKTVARTRTCRFVWSTSKRILQVLARIDSLVAPEVNSNPTTLFNIEALHKASSLDVDTDAFLENFDDFLALGLHESVIAVGLNPLSSARLFPLWAQAIAHQSPEEQVAAFVNGWIQLP